MWSFIDHVLILCGGEYEDSPIPPNAARGNPMMVWSARLEGVISVPFP